VRVIRLTRYRTLPRHEHRIGFMFSLRVGRRMMILERVTARKTVIPERVLAQFKSERSSGCT
jgi:hypothetical protein